MLLPVIIAVGARQGTEGFRLLCKPTMLRSKNN
jgi:hypothetical protein